MLKNKILLSPIFLISLILMPTQGGDNVVFAQETESAWFSNLEEAQTKAKQTDKPVLLVFSGSDWCKPCILFKKEVLESETFFHFAAKELILVNADFPAAKKNQLSQEQTVYNEKLAEKYNPTGLFPLALLIDKEGKVLKSFAYKKGDSPENFIQFVKSVLNDKGHTSIEKKQTHYKVLKLMGCRFEITAIHPDPQKAWDAINAAIAEITRIEKLISSWDKNSQTSAINKNAGIQAVKIDKELFNLIERSLKISQLTDGAFDISFAAIDKLWKFDGTMKELPDEKLIQQSIAKINWQHILLNKEEQSVFLKETGMKIGFGGIGKGYAANRAKKVMKKMGIENGLINASGDLTAWGLQEDQTYWDIAIADPKNARQALARLSIQDNAVVTSGDYEKYVEFNGTRYAHIIDPKTGWPTSGIKSVTIVCPDTELGDALATSVFVLGTEKGLNIINQLKGIECLIVTDKDEILTSGNLKLNNVSEMNIFK